MNEPQVSRILKASYHRNGISGEGFYAILFESQYGTMIASLFDEPRYCAVFNVQMLADGNVEFANGNSWRGDNFEDELRPMLKTYLDKNGTNRFGPFAFPEQPAITP